MTIKKHLLRGLIFLIILGIAICAIQPLFTPDDSRGYEDIRSFYREKRQSLDAVFIGASSVHAFWQPVLGWADNGIAVWNYSNDSLSAKAVLPMLKEVHRLQPDALYIICLNTFKVSNVKINEVKLHTIVDYQPFSLNKIRTIQYMTENTEFTGLDKLEFYFPIIRFHDRWDSLKSWAFDALDYDYKSSIRYSNFISVVKDQKDGVQSSDAVEPIPEDVETVLRDLLDYSYAKGFNLLFAVSPQVLSETELGRINYLKAIVAEYGYPCLDVQEEFENTEIQTNTDFYNKLHTNIHGSLKYTKYLGDYLVKHYGFSDKRGQPGWEEWDQSLTSYYKYIAPWCLPLEREHAQRDWNLPAPEIKTKVSGKTITVSWSSSDGADGYCIYRKTPTESGSPWRIIDEVNSETFTYKDEGLKANKDYTYTVVPYKNSGDNRIYGCFQVLGSKATTGGK